MAKLRKSVLLSYLLFLLLVVPVSADDKSLHLRLLNGSIVTIAEKQDKPMYLKFWASWCDQCREQMPHLSAIYKKYGDQLDVIAINPGWNETIELVKQFKRKFKLEMPIALEPLAEVTRALKVDVVPYSILIDKNGLVVYKTFGISNELDTKIAQLIRGK